MKIKWFALSALALSLGVTTSAVAARAYAAPAGMPLSGSPSYQDGQGRWDEPPSEYREAQRQGYRDGVEAARRDFEGRRHRDADDHESYRHPRVERELQNDYREAFRSGYSRAMHHMKEEGEQRDHDHYR